MRRGIERLLAAGVLAAACAACRATRAEVQELPFELALEFEGEESVGEARLTDVVHAELRRLAVKELDKAAIDDAAFALEEFYRKRGHADVLVEYALQPGDTPRALFRIEEGPLVHVREIVVEGASAITPERVRTFFGPASGERILVAEDLERGRAALRDLYLEKGHIRVAIDEPEVVIDQTSAAATVRILIREGPAFRVRDVEMGGGTQRLERREGQLARQYTGSLFRFGVRQQLENALVEAYRREGYPDVAVDVRPELDETSGEVRVVVEITPGDLVRLAHFRITGNERTKDATILSVLGIDYGSLYDSERLREAFRELYATGLFETISLELEGTGPERTLVVAVAEAPSLQVRLEPGWGSYEGPRFLVGIDENNFQGRAQVLALEGTVSYRAQEARIAWIDRDFLGSPFTSETTAYVEHREEPSFEFVRRGFGFFLRRNWTHRWNSTAGYEFRPTNVTDDPITALPQDFDSNTNVALLSLTLGFDDRDNPLVPTRGGRGLARVELAEDGLGSDTEFLRGQLEYTYLKRIGEENVLAFSARTGVMEPYGNTVVIPLPERFFNGGENSVRSFQEDELLPPGRDGDPLGGEAATTLNAEWRRALGGNLAGALFVDTGNVTENAQDYLEFAGFRTGIGVGMRYLLPIGPMRLDFAVNPAPESDEDEFVLHFSVGFPF